MIPSNCTVPDRNPNPPEGTMPQRDTDDYIELLDELESCGDEDMPPIIRLDMIFAVINSRRQELLDD